MKNEPILRQLALRAMPVLSERKPAPSRGEEPRPSGEETPARQARRSSSRGTWRRPDALFVTLATEPTERQRLLVGRWHHARYGRILAEGIIVGEHLGEDEADLVRRWARGRRSAVDRPAKPDEAFLSVLDARAFIDGPLYRRHVRGRKWRTSLFNLGTQKIGRGTSLISYDAAFTLSRFVRHAGRCLGTRSGGGGVYRGGLSMALWGEPGEDQVWADQPGYPRLWAKQLNDHVTLVAWAGDRLLAADGVLPGRILDLRHLGQAMAGLSGPTFDDLCAAFGVGYRGPQPGGTISEELLDWLEARHQVETLLYDAVAAEMDAWRTAGASKLRPPWLYSGGSLADHVVSSARFTPPQPKADLPDEVIGAFMGALHGGRTEASLLRWSTPVLIEDFSSMYPTVAANLGLGRLFACETISFEDVTNELTTWLHELAVFEDPVESLLDRAVWHRWGCTVALVESRGEWLPHRSITGPGEALSCFAPLTSSTPLPYTWPHLAAAVVKGGQAPRVLKAWRLVPEGQVETTPVKVPGTDVMIGDGGDVFEALLRARAVLHRIGTPAARSRESAVKRMTNSAAFGNVSRFDRELAGPDGEPQEWLDPWGGRLQPGGLKFAEDGARWTFAPAAATDTAGAQLVMAMAERRIVEAGGTVAAIHTDALMIGVSEKGGFWATPGGPLANEDGEESIRLLSAGEVGEALRPFSRLRPDGVPAFKAEHGTGDQELHVTVFGVNRYIVHDPGTGEVRHGAESHMGGTLLDSSGRDDARLEDGRRAWVAELHEDMVSHSPFPEWANRPAVSAWRATNLKQLGWLRHSLPDALPFTAMLVAHPSMVSNATPTDDDPVGVPVAPFDPDPSRWQTAPWRWRDGRPVRRFVLPGKALSGYVAADAFVAATVDEVAHRWQTGGDFGAVPAVHGAQASFYDGLYRQVATEGLPDVVLVGKEGDLLVEKDRRVLDDPTDRLTVVALPGTYLFDVRADLAREIVRLGIVIQTIPAGTLRAFVAGRGLQAGNARSLLAALDRLAFDRLLKAGMSGEELRDAPRAVRYEVLCRLLAGQKPARCEFPSCRKYARPSGRFCSEKHRGAAAERRRRGAQRAGI